MRKPGDKKVNRTLDRGKKVSGIAKEHLKLAIFLFHHRWRCTFDWEVVGVHEDTVHLLAGQKRLKNEYKDPDMLFKVNKAHKAGMIESIEEYLRSHHGVVRAPLAYVISKSITVQTCHDYPKYATP